MVDALLLIGGFIALVYGADKLVDGASSLARRLNIPNIIIGLTIVAFGTSAPELVVSFIASVNHSSDMAIGNVIGSNILNVLVILGISAAIRPLVIKSSTTWIEIPLSLLAAVVVLLMASDMLLDNANENIISRVDGLILLLFFLIFISYNISSFKNNAESISNADTHSYTLTKAILFFIAGLLLLVIGGRAIVYSATNIARFIGLSEKIIAVTIVALGTSLPELATSVVAARKNEMDIAVGNVVGSNIFNIFLVLGISAFVYPVKISDGFPLDIYVNIIASLLLFVFLFIGHGRKLARWQGGVFIFLYIVFVCVLLITR